MATMVDSIMGVWIIASVISASPQVQDDQIKKNLGNLATFSRAEATFSENACKNPKYAFHPKDNDSDDHVKISCPGHDEMIFPNLYAIDEQHIRAKINDVNYELFRNSQKESSGDSRPQK
jgi:hypothetical protein